VAQSHRSKTPNEIQAPDAELAPWCTWLRCAHCDAVRLHAVIADTIAQQWHVEGCDRERHNRLVDRCRRRIDRRLKSVAAEGVTVVEVMAPRDMQLDDALGEVVEYADARGVQLRTCAASAPVQLLRVLDDAEDVIDDLTVLGEWHDGAVGRWRGVALRA
jgi:hypothetical protein